MKLESHWTFYIYEKYKMFNNLNHVIKLTQNGIISEKCAIRTKFPAHTTDRCVKKNIKFHFLNHFYRSISVKISKLSILQKFIQFFYNQLKISLA